MKGQFMCTQGEKAAEHSSIIDGEPPWVQWSVLFTRMLTGIWSTGTNVSKRVWLLNHSTQSVLIFRWAFALSKFSIRRLGAFFTQAFQNTLLVSSPLFGYSSHQPICNIYLHAIISSSNTFTNSKPSCCCFLPRCHLHYLSCPIIYLLIFLHPQDAQDNSEKYKPWYLQMCTCRSNSQQGRRK